MSSSGPARVLHLLRHKEWPEQRVGVLVALSALAFLWTVAVAAALLAGDRAAATSGLGGWALSGFPRIVFYGFLPIYALHCGVTATREDRTHGTREFLLALPVRPRELWTARALSAGGAVLVFACAGWIGEGLLWLLASSPHGPVPFLLRGPAAGIFCTVLGMYVPLAAALLAARRAPASRADGWASSLALTATLYGVPLAITVASLPFGWWFPPWGFLVLALATGTTATALVCAEREGLAPVSVLPLAGGVGLAALLGAAALLWGVVSSVPPSAARTQNISVSPDGTALVLQPVDAAPLPRLWRWDAGEIDRGKPLRALPGQRAWFLGWGGTEGVAWYLRKVRWGRGRELVRSVPGGPPRAVVRLPASATPPTPEDFLAHGSGRDLFLDTGTGFVWELESATPLARVDPAATFLGVWGREALLQAPSRSVSALDLDTGRSRPMPEGPPPIPLRSGRWLAYCDREAGLRVWDDREGRSQVLSSLCVRAVWVHHLETLYFQDGRDLHAWHRDVGVRPLLERVDEWELLPGGSRILVLREGKALALHAGTRESVELPLAGPEAAFRADARAVSRDGQWLAVQTPHQLRIVDLESGAARSLPITSGTDTSIWVRWIDLPQAAASGAAALSPHALTRTGSTRFALVSPEGDTRRLDLERGRIEREMSDGVKPD